MGIRGPGRDDDEVCVRRHHLHGASPVLRVDPALEVGSFAPNGFGLHDMHGNAPEWVQDCFENTAYDDAPVDGSVHTPRDCRNRAVRGGSWADHPMVLRSAHRSYGLPGERRDNGFRVARTLVVR